MIVDTSALIAILFGEPEAEKFAQIMAQAGTCRLSVVSRLELDIVLDRQAAPDALRRAEVFLRMAAVVDEPVTLEQGSFARQAFLDFGKGRHKAGLNFGDCFAYALAKALDEPLLFKGGDFGLTDVRIAASA
ncbi:MAG: type II toxin-antitoxin system VapC family toxin [Acidobacteriota bacterium]